MTNSEAPSPFSRWLSVMGAATGRLRDADLARAIGVEQSVVVRWKSGSRPNVEHLWRVGHVFKTDLEALLRLTGHIPPGEYPRGQDEGPLDVQALAVAHRRIITLEEELVALRRAAAAASGLLAAAVKPGSDGRDVSAGAAMMEHPTTSQP